MNENRLHAAFVRDLPYIRKRADWYGRRLRPEAREEFVCNVVALVWHAWTAGERNGTALTWTQRELRIKWAVLRTRKGARLTGENGASTRAQRETTLARLQSQGSAPLAELCAQGAQPADEAALAIDYADWLQSLSDEAREAIALRVAGMSRDDAASALGRSKHTITSHSRRLTAWLEARAR